MIGHCLVLHSKLWGILEDSCMAWDVGFQRILVEVDSGIAILLISHLETSLLKEINEYEERK